MKRNEFLFYICYNIFMKIVMVAGGSGGHIYPALSLAEELKNRGHDITFIGSNDRMEKDVIPQSGFKYIGLNIYTTRGGLLQKAKSLFSIIRAYDHAKVLLRGYDLVMGFGNYISVPILLAAKKIGIKTIIHEQNSFVGRANRILDEKADLIISSYEEDLKQFKNKNNLLLGNPQASKAYNSKKDPEIIRSLGLDPNKKIVVIFMGSLGSSTVHKTLLDYFKLTDGSYQIIYATGKYNYSDELKKYENDYLKIFEKIDGISVMRNSDLLISRAGATTISEIGAIGIASILIPSPYVPNNHQYHNAMALVNKEAAIILEEKDLNARRLNDLVNSIINDGAKLESLANNAKQFSNPNVINDIIEEIENL